MNRSIDQSMNLIDPSIDPSIHQSIARAFPGGPPKDRHHHHHHHHHHLLTISCVHGITLGQPKRAQRDKQRNHASGQHDRIKTTKQPNHISSSRERTDPFVPLVNTPCYLRPYLLPFAAITAGILSSKDTQNGRCFCESIFGERRGSDVALFLPSHLRVGVREWECDFELCLGFLVRRCVDKTLDYRQDTQHTPGGFYCPGTRTMTMTLEIAIAASSGRMHAHRIVQTDRGRPAGAIDSRPPHLPLRWHGGRHHVVLHHDQQRFLHLRWGGVR